VVLVPAFQLFVLLSPHEFLDADVAIHRLGLAL
jgi:hypothetical protein